VDENRSSAMKADGAISFCATDSRRDMTNSGALSPERKVKAIDADH
jgi:hypothetical protein